MNHSDTTNTTDAAADDWIDGLLRSREAAALEAAPNAVRSAATAAIAKHNRRRRRRRSLAGLAAAAALGAIALWPSILLPRRDGSNRARSPVATERRAVVLAEQSGEGFSKPTLVQPSAENANVANSSPSPSLPGRGMVTPATFVSSDAIAVPVESPTPEVTIVQLYPTVDAQRRWRRESSAVPFSEPNGG